MPRLYRPHIPLDVRLHVALRQLGEMEPFAIAPYVEHVRRARRLRVRLAQVLESLARKLGCQIADLRLDHDPPLAWRPRFRRGLGKRTYYQPAANDPDHLLYRPHGPEYEGSHLIKTNVRGDHGQYPDRVLIKRERNRTQRKGRKKIGTQTSVFRPENRGAKRKWKAPRPAAEGGRTRRKAAAGGFPPGKRSWPSRSLRSGNRWPAKGTRKVRQRGR